MAGHHHSAQAADEHSNEGEHAGLGEQGDADRQTQTEQAPLHRPVRPLESLEQTTGPVQAGAFQVEDHAGQHEPHDQGSGHTTADTTHGGQAELAVDQHVVGRHIENQTEKTYDHRRFGAGQPVGHAAEGLIEADGGEAQGYCTDITHTLGDQRRIDAGPMQHGLHRAQQQAGEAAQCET